MIKFQKMFNVFDSPFDGKRKSRKKCDLSFVAVQFFFTTTKQMKNKSNLFKTFYSTGSSLPHIIRSVAHTNEKRRGTKLYICKDSGYYHTFRDVFVYTKEVSISQRLRIWTHLYQISVLRCSFRFFFFILIRFVSLPFFMHKSTIEFVWMLSYSQCF